MLNRRSFLRAAPAAGVAIAVPAVAIAAKPEMTPLQRLDAAIAELKAASEAIWPNANDWTIRVDGNRSMPILINAWDPSWNRRGKMKVYVDDGSPLLADDVTASTAFADWKRGRGV